MFLSRAGLYAITFRGAAEGDMVQRVSTVAFEGIEARAVDVQVQVAPGLPAFAIVGLPDKAVSEARERVRSALIASGLALPGGESPSTSPLPICRRKAATTICRSRSA
jgi:Subunit ChlI of Mg-chelatase